MLPEIAELEFETEEMPEALPPIGKTFLFDFKRGDFVMRNGRLVELHGKDALKMWIEKTIRTERGRFRIYDGTDYGIQLEDLVGTDYPRDFVEAEIKREVTEALTRHPHIDAIEDWRFERDGRLMRIWFTVITPEDRFEMEVAA